MWASNEDVLYLGPTHVMSVSLEMKPELRARPPEPLFKHDVYFVPPGGRSFDFDPASDRFLMIRNPTKEVMPAAPIVLVDNWLQEVSRNLRER